MVNKRDKNILTFILQEIDLALSFVQGISFDEFIENYEKQHATAMALLNVGEYSNKLSKELVSATEGKIPFRLIVDFRNTVAHDYAGLYFEDMWETVTKRVPILKEQLTELLDSAEDTETNP